MQIIVCSDSQKKGEEGGEGPMDLKIRLNREPEKGLDPGFLVQLRLDW